MGSEASAIQADIAEYPAVHVLAIQRTAPLVAVPYAVPVNSGGFYRGVIVGRRPIVDRPSDFITHGILDMLRIVPAGLADGGPDAEIYVDRGHRTS